MRRPCFIVRRDGAFSTITLKTLDEIRYRTRNNFYIIQKGANYIEGISTVTKIDDEFKVSNKYYVGFVADAWSNTSTYFVEFTDGTIMKFDDASAWNLNGGELAIVFYDYLGNPVGAAQGTFVDYSE